MQITSAMKMVSAAKLKRAQDKITQMRPYAEKLQEILSNVSSSLDSTDGVYSRNVEVKNVLIIAVTSNRGLCGGFNNNVIKETQRLMNEDFAGKDVKVLGVGKKSNDHFKKTDQATNLGLAQEAHTVYENLTYDTVAEVAQRVMDDFAESRFDQVVLVYNRFKNAAVQICTTEQFLPVLPPAPVEGEKATGEYIFEPNKEEIVQNIIPKSLKVQLYKAVLDSNASEHGARMTAMHKATDNAGELKKELTIFYNKARQAAITTEILEIVSGAEALAAG